MENSFNFNHRIILEKEEQNNNNYGCIESNFSVIAEVWANIEPVISKQNFTRMKDDLEISHTITIRYRNDAQNCKKILFGNRKFDVIGLLSPKENYNLLVFNVKEII